MRSLSVNDVPRPASTNRRTFDKNICWLVLPPSNSIGTTFLITHLINSYTRLASTKDFCGSYSELANIRRTIGLYRHRRWFFIMTSISWTNLGKFDRSWSSDSLHLVPTDALRIASTVGFGEEWEMGWVIGKWVQPELQYRISSRAILIEPSIALRLSTICFAINLLRQRRVFFLPISFEFDGWSFPSVDTSACTDNGMGWDGMAKPWNRNFFKTGTKDVCVFGLSGILSMVAATCFVVSTGNPTFGDCPSLDARRIFFNGRMADGRSITGSVAKIWGGIFATFSFLLRLTAFAATQ